MYDEDRHELVETNDITPFDSKEEIKQKQKEKYFKQQKFENQFERCKNCLEGKPDKFCPHYATCPYVRTNTANTIVNKFKDFDEIVCYNRNFYVARGVDVSDKVDKTRKWLKDEFGVLHAKSDDVTLQQLQNTIKNSRKRALDNLYGYILCNDWKYFVTVTFKHGKTCKLSDDVVMYQWQKFRQQLQYRFPDITIFLVKEDTPTGVHGLHFHGFIGNADLGEYLRPARNNEKMYNGKPNAYYGDFLYTKYGDPIFNFIKSFVNVGYTTVVKIKDPDKLKLVNYMTKYMHKGSTNFDYNENTYLRTYNLEFKEKEVCNFTKQELSGLINDLFVVEYKKTKDYVVYRKYRETS